MGLGPFILGAAGIQGASSLAGGKKGASAATQAANIQAQAAMAALGQQQLVREQNLAELQPFADFGRAGIPQYQTALDTLAQPIDTSLPQFTETMPGFPNLPTFSWAPTEAQLMATPGATTAIDQATKAEQARLGAMGLSSSGPAAVGAGKVVGDYVSQSLLPFSFNTALQGYQANNNAAIQSYQENLSGYQTRQQAFLANVQNLLAGRTMDLQQRQQIVNMLGGRVQTGLSGAGALASANLTSANQVASTITGAGAAQASGVVGAANAQIAGLQGVGQAATTGVNQLIGNQYTQLALSNALGAGGGGVVPSYTSMGLGYGSGYNTGYAA